MSCESGDELWEVGHLDGLETVGLVDVLVSGFRAEWKFLRFELR
jgi:hypothetical protein